MLAQFGNGVQGFEYLRLRILAYERLFHFRCFILGTIVDIAVYKS